MNPIMILVIILLPDLTKSFQPYNSIDGLSITHRTIIEKAILKKTAEVCRDIAKDIGQEFTLNIDGSLTVSEVQRACSGTPRSTVPVSAQSFQNSLSTIHNSNTKMDFRAFAYDAKIHFNNEEFAAGRRVITEGVTSIKSNVPRGNFEVGRQTLGRICHTLQDFYSHSDWVEMGNTMPYSTLIIPSQPLTNLAGQDVPTCSNCVEDVCHDNILPDILEKKLLTSGYFDVSSEEKPAGKCSHGGRFDKTSRVDPEGGINKDLVGSFHGYLHNDAANVATDATIELLEEIRTAVGDNFFLQFMGVSQSSALSFVIDTTGSMRDDIAAAKNTAFFIIDSRRGTAEEPSSYILVPFNDPEFGPVIRTTDPDIFKAHINELTASGGGDGPELSMSGLQLALTAAPPSSDIFLFTDATAKDGYLKNTVLALIESTKSRVTSILTNILTRGRRRRDSQSVSNRFTSSEGAVIYRDLARASGGQTIEVSKLNLIEGTAVIKDLSANAVVTVFQVTEDPRKPGNFTFIVDPETINIKIFITGLSSLTFQLTSPSGVSQNSSVHSGPLASITSVGNLKRILVNGTNETGTWELSVSSSEAYTVKVTGQSSVNFLYNIVKKRDGAHPGIDVQEGRPSSGGNVTLLVTVTGSDTAKVTHISLYDSSGPTQINGTLQALDSNNYLAEFKEIPAGDFVVRLTGEESNTISRSTPSTFQRQASTHIKTSFLSVTSLVSTSNLEPGSTISIPFTVSSNLNGTFPLQVNNDRSFPTVFPSSVSIEGVEGGMVNSTGTLTVPASVESGTDVTVTIQAQNAAGTEINFAVVRFSVVARVEDITGPECQILNISGICSHSSTLCASSQWELTANLTDGVNGTGIERIIRREGNGTFNTVTVTDAGGVNVTMLTYNSSCCSPSVILAAVDRVGNVGRCVGQARMFPTPTPMTVTNSTMNDTTAASTMNATTAASTMNATTAASTMNFTTAASTMNATTAASTMNFTTAASTMNATTAASTMNATTAASTMNFTTAASTMNATTAASTMNFTTAASTMNATTAASTMNFTTAASTMNVTTAASTMNATTAASTMNFTTAASTMNATTAASTMNFTTAASTMNATTAASTMNFTTAASTMNATTAASTMNATTAASTMNATIAASTMNATIAASTMNVTTAASTMNATIAASTMNFTTAASTMNATTAASTMNATTAASTMNFTTAASTMNATTAASTMNFTTAASTMNATTAASTMNFTTAASTMNVTTAASTMNATTAASTMNFTTAASTMNATTAASTMNFTTAASTMNATTAASTMNFTTAASTMNATTAASTMNATTAASTMNFTTAASTMNATIAASTMNVTIAASTMNATTAASTTCHGTQLSRLSPGLLIMGLIFLLLK